MMYAWELWNTNPVYTFLLLYLLYVLVVRWLTSYGVQPVAVHNPADDLF